ncbi:MAG TPA: hypothetical protein VIH90_05865 [Candidatus Saccharimonadales bacterium]
MASHELVPVMGTDEHRAAQEASTVLSGGQVHLAAQEAGFVDWLRSVDQYTLKGLGSNTSMALRMPFPSPTTQTWLAEAGYSSGVETEEANSWSLAVAEEHDRAEGFDTGVRLVVCKKVVGTKEFGIRFPLDVALSTYAYKSALDRPDRVDVTIGDRQLPTPRRFSNEEGQRLLIVASRFLNLLSSGQAAELTPSPNASRMRRILGR